MVLKNPIHQSSLRLKIDMAKMIHRVARSNPPISSQSHLSHCPTSHQPISVLLLPLFKTMIQLHTVIKLLKSTQQNTSNHKQSEFKIQIFSHSNRDFQRKRFTTLTKPLEPSTILKVDWSEVTMSLPMENQSWKAVAIQSRTNHNSDR